MSYFIFTLALSMLMKANIAPYGTHCYRGMLDLPPAGSKGKYNLSWENSTMAHRLLDQLFDRVQHR